MKTRSTPASLPLKRPGYRYTTVKWSIDIVTVDDRFASNRTSAVIVT